MALRFIVENLYVSANSNLIGNKDGNTLKCRATRSYNSCVVFIFYNKGILDNIWKDNLVGFISIHYYRIYKESNTRKFSGYV
jgi:hypothetical protein